MSDAIMHVIRPELPYLAGGLVGLYIVLSVFMLLFGGSRVDRRRVARDDGYNMGSQFHKKTDL